MLTGVLLHQIKPALPIDAAGNGFTYGNGLIAQMDDGFALFPDGQNPTFVQNAGITGLAAPFRIKSGGIQGDLPTFFCLFAIGHLGGKFRQMAVFVV